MQEFAPLCFLLDLGGSLGYFIGTLKIPVKAYTRTIVSALVILLALLMPSSAIPSVKTPFGFDKFVHFGLFFIFALIYLGDYRNDKKRNPKLLYSISTILVFILITELLQLLSRTRHFEFMDIIAGVGGAFTALIIARVIRAKIQK